MKDDMRTPKKKKRPVVIVAASEGKPYQPPVFPATKDLA